MWTFLTIFFINIFLINSQYTYRVDLNDNQQSVTEHPGGIIKDGKQILYKSKSPYWLRNDIIVEKNAEFVIEPGVEVRFEPMIGITVRGILKAEGTINEPITLTSSKEAPVHNLEYPIIRLVDGPSILAGRVQIFHNDEWRSVCTNSKNWTRSDLETACRHLGFQGGSFFSWFNRQMPLKPRLLYEQPKCIGTEQTLRECQWESRQLGSGVCDYHPDIGIQCQPRHDHPLPFWRGIRFENSANSKDLERQSLLYVLTSRSKLSYVKIKYAGNGRDHNATSAVQVLGVAPVLNNIKIVNSAYNGINITKPESPVVINNCEIRNNRGFGVFINSSYGLVDVFNSSINGNGADGIKYVYNEERPDENPDRSDLTDLCLLPVTSGQTYPISIFVEQKKKNLYSKTCQGKLYAAPGHVLTINFIRSETDRNNTATFRIYDGHSQNDNLLAVFNVRNNTRPQSVTTTSNRMSVVFDAEAKTEMFSYIRITSGIGKSYDLRITNTTISDNNGRGVGFENLRTQIRIHNSSISNNNHVAGVHIISGVGDVNVTDSRISFNNGDGINITYTGGNRNISRSSISSNRGFGIAIWINNTEETEYIFHNQTTVVQYSEIIKNIDTGVLHGNFCGLSYSKRPETFIEQSIVNITGNIFKSCVHTGLEIISCWDPKSIETQLQIGHNRFIGNEHLGIKIKPALKLNGRIEFNNFNKGIFGSILIQNQPLEEFNNLRSNFIINQNNFQHNQGMFIVNLGLSPYSEVQKILFYRNFVRYNKITEPYEDGSKLVPRTRVAAPIVVSSPNVDIFRNILENPDSKYEIGSHLEDQSKTINCTFNWLGSSEEKKIFNRIFHRNDRYNLAKISFIPFLLHSSHPLSNLQLTFQQYVPKFYEYGQNTIGGEVEGEEHLPAGEYVVERDINIRPGGKLVLDSGVTLKFPPSLGMMVGGKLEARGSGPDSIRFTLKEEIVPENETYDSETEKYDSETELIEVEPKVPIRLLGGKTTREGRLQIKIDNEWGTVCNYRWTIRNAAVVCNQLGLVLNPDDWFMERNEIPDAGTAEDVIVTNIECDEFDMDITKCRSDKSKHFEQSCTHEHDVGVRCYESSWAGIRFGVLSERSDLQFITIDRAGLLDYSTNQFKPALQIDLARHSLENVKIVENYYDGIGVIYSDIYSADAVNMIRNSEISKNMGNGISFKQLGMKIHGCEIEANSQAGIRHNPALSSLQQREIAGWFMETDGTNYHPIKIPANQENIYINEGETKYIVTSKIRGDSIKRNYYIQCPTTHVLGIQLLNPIGNLSTETISIHDSQSVNYKSARWSVNRDLSVFPTTSSSYGILMFYESGVDALGGTVIAISSVRAPVQDIRNKIVKGPVPTLTLINTKIRGNTHGIYASYYNRYLNELGDHFLRKSNETFKIIHSEISHNKDEAIFVNSPYWDIFISNISEITFMINNSLIVDNGKGIYHFSRDMRSSNNLFHYVLQDNTVERNALGGFEINLPYVWQYDENFTHSVYFDNNTFRNNRDFGIIIDGHFSQVNLTNNHFTENSCKNGLISFRGMEKKMLIKRNVIRDNIGKFMMEFNSDSQSEIMGDIFAQFVINDVRNNRYVSVLNRGKGMGILQLSKKQPTSVVKFSGIQKVQITQNLFSNNNLEYQLIAGIKTARINNFLDVKYNWWGTKDERIIEKQIFDFDDWNNHAVAMFKPYLTEDSFDSSNSLSIDTKKEVDFDNFGGRITENLVLPQRSTPYIIRQDITIMPDVQLTIQPGVIMEFAPNVGILVLGTLKANGIRNYEITMRPLMKNAQYESKRTKRSVTDEVVRPKRQIENMYDQENIRLCQDKDCVNANEEIYSQGFLEYFNRTTLQWIPMCDPRFTERNAQVVCRQLGFDSINVYFDHDIRIDYHSNSLSRIWSWPEPLQCTGTESFYEDCPIRLNGQLYGHRHECKWDSKFVFIHCGKRNLEHRLDYWGGIRFTGGEFEQHLYEHRIHDHLTHNNVQKEDSELEFVNIIGAGILHNEKSPAVQSIIKTPKIKFVNISKSAFHGVNIISPSRNVELLYNNIDNTLGVGTNIVSLTGEGASEESSFTPLKDLNIPYNLFSLVDICDTTKVITIEERVLLYYKYDNHPINCVKIFKSAYHVKPLGFRLLQFNLFNSTNKPGKHDSIELFDGDIYNVSSIKIGELQVGSMEEKRLFKTKEPSLSVKLFANGASSNHGFIAEIVTLPISIVISANRDIQHNISYSTITNNREGAIQYHSAGEVNPIITLERNQFIGNCLKLYGNFTTCKSSLIFDIQNTQTLYFRNNLVKSNQGGLSIKADSRGSATSLKAWIHNNLFYHNLNLPALNCEGRQSSPYQEVIIYRNYFTQNYAQYDNTIILKQVLSNFTLNYIKKNTALNILEVSGFEKVSLPIYQTTSHNGFYRNYATHQDSRSTVVAGTAGQHYVDNIFFNPDNDYEMITVNRSKFIFDHLYDSDYDTLKTKIHAAYNYWSYNETLAVSGRIRDMKDDPELLEVIYTPYYMNNKTILNGKCPPGWDLVGDTCYMYIGAPMTFEDARAFCRGDNASMPYIIGNYHLLYHFLLKQQQWYHHTQKVWIQDIDRINQCTVFAYNSIEIDKCHEKSPFICEIDPKVYIDPLSWRGDIVITATIGIVAIALFLILLVAGCWYSKSKYRHVQRMERRNSIRQSLNSLRSVGTNGGFSEFGYRRKPGQLSSRSTDTLTKDSNYKKMVTNGSIDSMEKSTFNSSIDDNQSYDVFEAHNPNPNYSTYSSTTHGYTNPKQNYPAKPQNQQNQYTTPEPFGLSYKNEGFRDNSTFASRNNSAFQSRADSILDTTTTNEETPIIHSSLDAHDDTYTASDYYNADTLPLHGKSDSTLNLKKELDDNKYNYQPQSFLQELKSKIPQKDDDSELEQSSYMNLPTPPEPPKTERKPYYYKPDYNTVGIGIENPYVERPSSANILETNLDNVETPVRPMPKSRSKSEALLETNFDYDETEEVNDVFGHTLTENSRSKSQPLETAM